MDEKQKTLLTKEEIGFIVNDLWNHEGKFRQDLLSVVNRTEKAIMKKAVSKEKVRKVLDEYIEYFEDSKILCHGRDLKILDEVIIVFGKVRKQLLGEK